MTKEIASPKNTNADVIKEISGTVDWFDGERGFIRPDSGSRGVLFHLSNLKKFGHESVDPNTKVSVRAKFRQKNRRWLTTKFISIGEE